MQSASPLPDLNPPSAKGTINADVSREQLIRLLASDVEAVLQFTIPEQIELEVPDVHRYCLRKMLLAETSRLCIAIPRGFAKTTLAKVCAAWHLYFTPHRFIVYLSNTHTVAANALKDIVAFIESDNYVSLFGAPVFEMRRESEGFYIFTLTDANGNTKRCILRALGATQQVRGLNVDNQRPDLAIVDDVESREDIATDEQLKKLVQWFYSTFIKAMDVRKSKIIQVGNMVQMKCMVDMHCNSPVWDSVRLGAVLANGNLLWGELWSAEALQKDFEEYERLGLAHLWFAEMMNLPLPDGAGLIAYDKIQFAEPLSPNDERIRFGCITIDPSTSQKEWANETAIAVHVYIDDDESGNSLREWNDVSASVGLYGGYWQCAEVVGTTKAGDPIRLFDVVFALCEKWGINVVGVESVAYQQSIKPVMEYLCTQRGIIGMHIENLPLPRASKTQRLMAWAALIASGAYRISRGQQVLTNQLINYDPASQNNADDRIDACAHIIIATKLYLPLIMQSVNVKLAGTTGGVINPSVKTNY